VSDKAEKLRIEYLPLDKLVEAPRNPKQHSLEEIKASMRRFGFVAVPAINETTGRLVAGHGRKEALVEMQAAGEPPPQRIRVKNKAWLVPVLRGVAFATDAEAEAYLLADNRLTEIGGNDEAVLAQILADLKEHVGGLQGVGYNDEDVARILKSADPSSVEFPEFGEDAANDVQYQECPACGHKFPK
jgi:hypothetical protein